MARNLQTVRREEETLLNEAVNKSLVILSRNDSACIKENLRLLLPRSFSSNPLAHDARELFRGVELREP